MLRLLACAITLATNAATLSVAQASCDRPSEISAARLCWAGARQHIGTGPAVESCRIYTHVFLEAVNTRHVASICEEGADRQRDLALLDADIDTFNNLIAANCGGS
jgi:hypothetical protein